MEWINHMFEQYGYYLLFFGLFSESLAAPFPGELAMAYSGYMVSTGSFNVYLVLLWTFLGTTIGTTITYAIGRRLGTPFFIKYGKYFFLHPHRIDKITAWFGKYGNKLLLISYFIPGFRHFTGYVSGIIRIRFRTFLLFNHMGALLWITTYVMIGKILGKRFEHFLHLIAKYSIRAVIGIAIGLALVYLIKKYREVLWSRLRKIYEYSSAAVVSISRKMKLTKGHSYALLLALLILVVSLLSK